MIRRPVFSLCLLFILLQAGVVGAQTTPPGISLAEGSGSFEFVDAKGDPDRQMTVFTYVPPSLDLRTARLLFVLHGTSKNAAGMRDIWKKHADAGRYIVLAPQFSKQQWPGTSYAYSSVATHLGVASEPSKWSFSVIEHLFDAVKAATDNQTERYFIYGHSEGGQFVHRLVLLLPEARYERAIAANAGWYTLPDLEIRFPYGLMGTPIDARGLQTSLGRDVIVLLGENDTATSDAYSDLNKVVAGLWQGRNRLERGRHHFAVAQKSAKALNCTLNWRLERVPDAGHQNYKMAAAAARHFKSDDPALKTDGPERAPRAVGSSTHN